MNKDIKPQLHISMLNQMARCGIQFQRRFGYRFGIWHKEEIIPPSIALLVGTSTHAVIEKNLRNKMDNGSLLTAEAVKDYARDSFSGRMEKEGLTLSGEEVEDSKNVIGTAIDTTISLSSLHHSDLAPLLEPVAIEEPFVIELNGYPYDLAGKIDIREDCILRDTKTSAKSPAINAAMSLQMAMYSLSEQVQRGSLPIRVYLDYLVKTKTPKIVTRAADPEPKWIDPLLHRVKNAIEIIEAVKAGKQALQPADPESYWCTRRFCGYSSTCKYWSGR